MQIAAQIDCVESQVMATNARILVLAIASGIGLTATSPMIAAGNGTAGEWKGKLEARATSLTMSPPPAVSVTAAFRDATLRGAARLPEGAVAQSGYREIAVPARSPEFTSRAIGRGSVEGRAPLDPVRIALPPAPAESGPAGAMLPETLKRVTDPDVSAPEAAPAAGTQSLVISALPASQLGAEDQLLPGQPFGLLSISSEVRDFDLARLAKPVAENLAPPSSRTLAATKAVARSPKALTVAKVPDRIVGDHILHVAGLSLEGVPSGNLSVRIGMSGDLSVKLADLLTPLQDQMAPESFQRLIGSSAASEYVSFADLRAAGLDVRYDAGNDSLMISGPI